MYIRGRVPNHRESKLNNVQNATRGGGAEQQAANEEMKKLKACDSVLGARVIKAESKKSSGEQDLSSTAAVLI